MADQRHSLGKAGEELAVRQLQKDGLRIVEQNWRCSVGELDIIAQEDAPDYVAGGSIVPWLVFVEVRTRRGIRYGSALQSVTPRKQAKLSQVAHHYVQENCWNGPWRIDVVGVQMDSSGYLTSIEHIRHAVSGQS
ncbi:MAG: YraN family protein [Chloroflexota bacterium]